MFRKKSFAEYQQPCQMIKTCNNLLSRMMETNSFYLQYLVLSILDFPIDRSFRACDLEIHTHFLYNAAVLWHHCLSRTEDLNERLSILDCLIGIDHAVASRKPFSVISKIELRGHESIHRPILATREAVVIRLFPRPLCSEKACPG